MIPKRHSSASSPWAQTLQVPLRTWRNARESVGNKSVVVLSNWNSRVVVSVRDDFLWNGFMVVFLECRAVSMGQGQEVHARRLLQQSMAGVCYALPSM